MASSTRVPGSESSRLDSPAPWGPITARALLNMPIVSTNEGGGLSGNTSALKQVKITHLKNIGRKKDITKHQEFCSGIGDFKPLE